MLPENGSLHGGLAFSPTVTSPTFSTFNLVSFDAAQYWDAGSTNYMVVGYKGMFGTVTNFFQTQVSTWQTFTLDSSFTHLSRVDIYASSYYGRFSLDNVVISGVPEPMPGALVLLGAACVFSRLWIRSRRR